MVLKSTNPYTGKVIKEFEEYSDEEVERVMAQSAEAFEKWKRTSFEYRGSLMEKAAALLQSQYR